MKEIDPKENFNGKSERLYTLSKVILISQISFTGKES